MKNKLKLMDWFVIAYLAITIVLRFNSVITDELFDRLMVGILGTLIFEAIRSYFFGSDL